MKLQKAIRFFIAKRNCNNGAILSGLPRTTKGREVPEFSYGVIERALSRVYGAGDDVRQSAFRGRLNRIWQAGVFGSSARVGTGSRATYTVPQIERVIAVFEMAEMGISPTVAARMVVGHWDKFAPILRAAQGTVIHDADDGDIVLALVGAHLMSSSWASPADGEDFPGLPFIHHCTVRELPKRMPRWMKKAAALAASPRVLVTDLSAALRKFHQPFGEAYLDELAAEYRERNLAVRGAEARRGRN
jgi:hypothetical protein